MGLSTGRSDYMEGEINLNIHIPMTCNSTCPHDQTMPEDDEEEINEDMNSLFQFAHELSPRPELSLSVSPRFINNTMDCFSDYVTTPRSPRSELPLDSARSTTSEDHYDSENGQRHMPMSESNVFGIITSPLNELPELHHMTSGTTTDEDVFETVAANATIANADIDIDVDMRTSTDSLKAALTII